MHPNTVIHYDVCDADIEDTAKVLDFSIDNWDI